MNVTEFSPKQKEVIHWWSRPSTESYDGIIADGSIRSGKTISMICGFLLWSQACYSRSNFILAGVTHGALSRNVIMPMKEILSDWEWPFTENKSNGYLKIGSNYYWMFGGGATASQDKMQGLTASGAYADEAALMSDVFLNQMIARCSAEGAKLWFNCNPENPNSFFKTDYIDSKDAKNLLYLHFTMEDNPGLPTSTKERYERMYSGVFYERYILGLWTLAEGLIYPMYEDAIEDTYDGDRLDYVISIDYGVQNPFVALKWVKGSDLIWHCVEEYYYSGRKTGHQKTDADYVKDMVAFTHDAPARDIRVIVDPSATSFIAAMRRCEDRSFKMVHANNEVLPGIEETATCLQKSQGLIKVSRDCKNTIEEFGSYVWDEKLDSDKPVKEHDHAMDAMRYFVHTLRVYRPNVNYRPLIG